MAKLSQREKKQRREDKLYSEIYDVWKREKEKFPNKYTHDRFATNSIQAEIYNLPTYWSKCKYGHIVEKKLASKNRNCPICEKVSKTVRAAKIRKGNTIKLNGAERTAVSEIYEQSRKLTEETGVQHHVDHIRPLAAGGVHHPNNLQIITAAENIAKSSIYNGKKYVYSKSEKRKVREEFKSDLRFNNFHKQRNERKINPPSSIPYLIFVGVIFFSIIFSAATGK